MWYGIYLIILGLLVAPSILLEKKPNAKELLEKILPYQGWAGIAFCLLGIVNIIFIILGIAQYDIILWVFALLCALTMTILGFILGYSLIAKYALSKNETAKAKGEALLLKLQPLSVKLGIFGIVLGVLYTILYIVL